MVLQTFENELNLGKTINRSYVPTHPSDSVDGKRTATCHKNLTKNRIYTVQRMKHEIPIVPYPGVESTELPMPR